MDGYSLFSARKVCYSLPATDLRVDRSRSFKRVKQAAYAGALVLAGAVSPAVAQTATPLRTDPTAGVRTTSPNTMLPTDLTEPAIRQDLPTFGQNLNIRLLQKLPASLFINESVETSFRYETNPFQFPRRSALRHKLGLQSAEDILALPADRQANVLKLLRQSYNDDVIFRVLPNTTIGWALPNRTSVFFNHFLIRDQVFQNRQLSTTINSLSLGVQKEFPVGRRANLQPAFQIRELFVQRQQPVFDFLPGLTLSFVATPHVVAYVNTLLQLRGKQPMQAPTKEIDPFYSFGLLQERHGWFFSGSATFVQNFRQPFGRNASVPVNSYTWISDFEVARTLIKQVPGIQGFVRAEPIWNFHSNQTPGLSGFDMRVFGGIRMTGTKRAINTAIEQIREDIMNEEKSTPGPST